MTSEFTLSEFLPSDAADLTAILQDQTIHQNTLSIPNPYTEADANRFINYCINNHKKWKEDGKPPLQNCIRNSDGKVIGSIGVDIAEPVRFRPTRGIIGYYLHKDYRGRGIIPKALEVFIARAFSPDWNVERLEGDTFSFNASSGRVFEKCGFQYEGCMRGYYKKPGVEDLIDGNSYALLRKDWEKKIKEDII